MRRRLCSARSSATSRLATCLRPRPHLRHSALAGDQRVRVRAGSSACLAARAPIDDGCHVRVAAIVPPRVLDVRGYPISPAARTGAHGGGTDMCPLEPGIPVPRGVSRGSSERPERNFVRHTRLVMHHHLRCTRRGRRRLRTRAQRPIDSVCWRSVRTRRSAWNWQLAKSRVISTENNAPQ